MDYITYAVAVAVVFLGTKVSVDPSWVETNRKAVSAWLIGLGLAGLVIGGIQDNARDRAVADLTSVTSQLNTALSEQKRLAELNSKQQQQVLTLSERNSQLAQHNRELADETLRTARGDPDNPPYLWVFDFDFDAQPAVAHPYIVNSSTQYAAQNVNLSADLDGVGVSSRASSVPPGSRVPAYMPSPVGLESNNVNITNLDEVGKAVRIRTEIASSAGSYSQVTELVRVSEKQVLQSVRVHRSSDPSRVVFQKTDPQFPRDLKWPKEKS